MATNKMGSCKMVFSLYLAGMLQYNWEEGQMNTTAHCVLQCQTETFYFVFLTNSFLLVRLSKLLSHVSVSVQ